MDQIYVILKTIGGMFVEDDTRINSVPVVFGDAAISVFRIQSRQTLINGIDPRGKTCSIPMYIMNTI